jgi:hypothetical protein
MTLPSSGVILTFLHLHVQVFSFVVLKRPLFRCKCSWRCSLCSGDFAVYYPPSHTRIPWNRRQRPSTIDIVLPNGLHEIENLSTRIELSSDHLLVPFEVCSDSRREIPDHFIFNYKHADWNQFKLILDSRIDLDFSLDRIENESQIDLMIDTFTTVLLEARLESVHKTSPFRIACSHRGN